MLELAMFETMDFTASFSPMAQRAIAWLQAQRVPCWVVGGTVRDALLRRPSHDLDLAVPSDAVRLAKHLADALGAAFFPLDAARDVGRAVLTEPDGSQTYVDVAALRGPTLADDLRLRDFTLNALALDIQASAASVIDVTGGLADLQRRILRVANEYSFRDDPLRTLRGVRLALAFDLTWDAPSLALARRHASALAQVAAERVREELNRAFVYSRADLALHQLDDIGALAIVLPEIKALQGVTQAPPHRLDVYAHTLEVARWTQALLAGAELARSTSLAEAQLEALLAPFNQALSAYLGQTVDQGHSRAGLLVWSAILHDMGKPATRQVDAEGAITFRGHEAQSGRLAGMLLKRLAFSAEASHLVTRTCTEHRRAGALAALTAGRPDHRQVYHYFQAAHPVGVEVALLSLADHLAAWGADLVPERWQARRNVVHALLTAFFAHYAERVRPQPLLDGRQLLDSLGLAPGPQVGALLAQLREEQAAGVITTEAEAWDFVRAAAAR
jgi:tRNA nucleotidyltransferase/poly(A) polymerase